MTSHAAHQEPLAAGGLLGPGAATLRQVALRFLRRFGLVCAGWTLLLAVTTPHAERPEIVWAAAGMVTLWALASLAVPNAWWWGAGWLLVGSLLELAGPAAGTDGWSLVGGATFLVIAAAAVSGRRRLVVAVVVVLAAAALARPLLSPGWNIGGGVSTLLIFALGATGLTWLVRVVTDTVEERDRLASELARAERDAAVAAERAEAAARLHDSVLQTLSQLERASSDPASARLAAAASADLRAFLRHGAGQQDRLRVELEQQVLAAAGNDRGRVRLATAGEDPPCDEALARLVEAATEAVRNAIAHTSGRVSVMCEATPEQVTVWVADEGSGFDPDEVPADRLGVRESIVGRLERAGGSATLARTRQGAEWRLWLPRDA
jgi:signal transduction histidine kinase